MPAHQPTATRRGSLLGAVGAAGVVGWSVTGCDVPDLDPRSPLPAPGPDGSPTAEPDPDGDTAVVAEVVALISVREARVEAVRRRHRVLRRPLRPLARMHQAHLDVLDPTGRVVESVGIPVTPPSNNPRRDERRVVRAEQTLKAEVARAAERVESGSLAKLLASISASIAQHLDVLVEDPT